MSNEEIIQSIKKHIPDAQVEIKDTKGDGNHYQAVVSSSLFEGKSLVEQHQMVFRALEGKVGSQMHAFSLHTKPA